jgi:hypothetical protein
VLSDSGTERDQLFYALYNFVIQGKDVRPDRRIWIFPRSPEEPNLVARAIRAKQQEWGPEREIEFWKKVLDPTLQGFLSDLRDWSRDAAGTVVSDEFKDLATLTELMLSERLKELGYNESMGSSDGGTAPSRPRSRYSVED